MRRACLMMPRSCLGIRTRHHVKPRWLSLEDMRAPGGQAGLPGEPGPGGRGWGVGGAGTGRGGGERSGGSGGLDVGEGRRSGERGSGSCGGAGSGCEWVTRSAPPGGAGTAAGLAPSSRVDPQKRGELSSRQPQGAIATWRRGPELRRRALCPLEATPGLSWSPSKAVGPPGVSRPPAFLQGRRQWRGDELPAEVLPAPRRSAEQQGEESRVFARGRYE
ncbi:translation initiation factor IF-2-like [Peromyscus californicus insignis]|uniref:translation initiation factor IF-2-like n=1 Tax=Peromyscus californicus insignis TaxID=564181 RepID=UPI0022A6C768|nr:translation initiation factor IF-2-like [Peromyscus californicus insignis]